MVLKSLGVLSCAKITGALYAVLGLIGGAFFALFSLLGAGVAASQSDGGAFIGMLFGVGAIIFLPLFYGVMGFVMGALTAFVYNIVAGFAGGVEMELE
ncbi:MAG: hypothetical protein OES25_12325 [Acidobacteriota bacterium]|nr:hypothetical protein [Acidobacteriota bacterium]